MKRTIVSALAILAVTIGALAVPPGTYYDRNVNLGRNIMKAIVDRDGKTIYVLNNDGRVKETLTVVNEYNDGSFIVQDEYGLTYSSNAYFYEDGKLYLNLKKVRQTLVYDD